MIAQMWFIIKMMGMFALFLFMVGVILMMLLIITLTIDEWKRRKGKK